MFACMVALVTPMHENGQIDFETLKSLIEWHIASGTEAIVVLGTTGESPTLSHEERTAIIKTAVEQIHHRVPLFVGTGTYDTRTSTENSLEAERLGADGVLVINPYYNKPTQEGLYLHFKAIHDALTIPIILYNHPGRTGGSASEETIARLSQLPRIIGIKDTTYDYERIAEIRALCRKDFQILSACDDNTLEFMRAGGNGIISVTANIVPALMKKMVHAQVEKNNVLADSLQKTLMPLHHATCLETNPIPVKYALYLMKKIPIGIRLPLTVLEKKHQTNLEDVLRTLSL